MHVLRSLKIFLLALISILLVEQSAHAAKGVILGINELVIVNGARCGLVKNSWIPGSVLKNGSFYSLSQQIKDQKKLLKKKGTSKAKIKKIKAKISTLNKKLRKQKAFCKQVPSLLTPTPTPTSIATPRPDAVQVAWNKDLSDVSSNLGGEYIFFCPANPTGSLESIYGTSFYTSDSSVCVAAVHMGLFKRGSGGNVKARIAEGKSLYMSSVRNGIQSNFYGPYTSSFVFIDFGTGAEIISTDVPEITWSTTAGNIYQLIDQRFTFYCPSRGSTSNVWGTDIYTYDSRICPAAVHAGLISFQNGGVVTIEIKPGQSSYTGSTRHGVTSESYGPWTGSYIFVN